MGVGRPQDILEAVACGIDLFDCVLPTRNGRNAYAFTAGGPLRLRNSRLQRDAGPIEDGCDCYACRSFSRGVIRHYFFAGEMLGPILASVHNIRFYQRLMEDILRVQPNNLVVLVERAQVAARRRDGGALRETLGRLSRLSAGWSPLARNQLEKVKKAAEGPLPGDVPDDLTLLNNVLKPERGYQPSARAVQPRPKCEPSPMTADTNSGRPRPDGKASRTAIPPSRTGFNATWCRMSGRSAR